MRLLFVGRATLYGMHHAGGEGKYSPLFRPGGSDKTGADLIVESMDRAALSMLCGVDETLLITAGCIFGSGSGFSK